MHADVVVPLLTVAAYLVGSVPFGLLIGWWRGVDIRTRGSGNIGATNVGRVLGRPFGIAVFVADMTKGLVPTLAAGWVLRRHWPGWDLPESTRYLCWLGVGAGCVLGHNYPLYLRFRGGKGVSTSLGVTLGVYPDLTWAALAAFGVWVAVVGVSRYVSLGSVCAAIALPLSFVGLSLCRGRDMLAQGWPLLGFSVVLAVIVLIGHRSNIGRLLAGNEAKIGSRGRETAAPDSK